MKRLIIIVFISLAVVIFCIVRTPSETSTFDEVKIRLLQTADVHGHYLYQKKKNTGGWLRVASLIREARQGYPNNLLIDCGDTIQGSAIATLGRGEIAVNLLNSLNYDAWILGNHELDFGLTRLDELISQTKIPIICGNFSFKSNKFPPWKIYKKDGVKIALIGLQVAYLRHWFVGKDYEDFKEISGYDIVKKSLQELRIIKPDIIIVAAHQGCVSDWRGVNEINAICRDFPEVNIVFGGHTHRNVVGKKINKTYYMQAGAHANYLGVLDLTYDKKLRKISSIQSHFKSATSKVPYDEPIYKIVQERLTSLANQTNTTLFTLTKKITRRKMSEITAQAIAESTSADFVLQRSTRYGLPKGAVSLRQLFRLYPYENRLFTVFVNHEELNIIYQEQEKAVSGRGQELWSDGRQIKKITKFPGKKRLTLNSYTTAGAGRYPKLVKIIDKNRQSLIEYSFVIRDVVKNYFIK